MPEDDYRILPVKGGKVPCLPGKDETIEHCRFCIHSRAFRVKGKFVTSPSLAYCTKSRATDEVDLKVVESVKCADRKGEGYHSMMNIIG